MASPEETVVLVVPCYNEAARLRPEAFVAALSDNAGLQFVLVDDGSRDGTARLLESLAAAGRGRASVLVLPENRGKAEAVRLGMLEALSSEPWAAGFWDADLATPFDALGDFVNVLRRHPEIDIVIGSRVQLLGRDIKRSSARHYAGRVFATAASITLGLPVYDTQCGAKLFRGSRRARRIFGRPFDSRWIFDVELLSRYLDDTAGGPDERAPSASRVYELALRRWTDEPGSKVKARDAFRAFRDLVRIYHGRRRRPPKPTVPSPTGSGAVTG